MYIKYMLYYSLNNIDLYCFKGYEIVVKIYNYLSDDITTEAYIYNDRSYQEATSEKVYKNDRFDQLKSEKTIPVYGWHVVYTFDASQFCNDDTIELVLTAEYKNIYCRKSINIKRLTNMVDNFVKNI